MPLLYIKLASATDDVQASPPVITRAQLLADIESGDTKVVNLKGRILTATEMAAHLDGTTDGDTLDAAPLDEGV